MSNSRDVDLSVKHNTLRATLGSFSRAGDAAIYMALIVLTFFHLAIQDVRAQENSRVDPVIQDGKKSQIVLGKVIVPHGAYANRANARRCALPDQS